MAFEVGQKVEIVKVGPYAGSIGELRCAPHGGYHSWDVWIERGQGKWWGQADERISGRFCFYAENMKAVG